MGKKRHNRIKSTTAEGPRYELHNIKSSLYHGAARFLEIAPPGIQFRSMTNVDHITAITFGNHIEEIKNESEEGVTIEERHTGFDVIICIGEQQRAFTFHRLEVAILYYNDLLDMLAALGVPCAMKPRIQFTPPPEPVEKEYEIVGADGQPIEADNNDDDDPLIEELDELVDEPLEDDEQPTEH